MEYGVVIVAAGKAKRAKLGYNKNLFVLDNERIIDKSINVFSNDEDCKEIVVVLDEDNINKVKQSGKIKVVAGGELRKDSVYICDDETKVLMAENNTPLITTHKFFMGTGVYISGFRHSMANNRTLLNLILSSKENVDKYITDNYYTECSYYPESGKLVIINNSDKLQTTTVKTDFGMVTEQIDAYDIKIINLK